MKKRPFRRIRPLYKNTLVAFKDYIPNTKGTPRQDFYVRAIAFVFKKGMRYKTARDKT